MIDGLKPFPEYKDSDLPWLGRIPAHWGEQLGFAVFREKQEKNTGMRENRVLSLSYGQIVIKPVEKLHGLVPDSFETYQIVDPGDLIIRSTDLQNDWTSLRVGLVRDRGIITSAYLCLKNLGSFTPAFAFLMLHSYDLQKFFYGLGSGLRQNLGFGDFKRLPFPVPPNDEQTAIVRFLDYAGGRIDGAIRAKKELIALLNEQKQAIIHRAVTRGLDPNVPLKSSGIPWVGDIPRHWQILRAKYLFREVDERSTNGSEELLSVSHITGVTPRSQKNITMFKARSYIGHKLCCPGDLVVNTMWAWMAALGVSAYAGIISPAYAVYRPRHAEQFVGHYIDVLLRTKPYVSNIICHSTGVRASRLRLYPEEFFRLPIILPPVREQSRIVENIAAETAHLEASTIHAEREIALLHEYRTRLTADVVTGKLDVHESARKLPDTAEEAGATLEIEELTDVEAEREKP